MNFELGVYSFGNTPCPADGGLGLTAQAIRDVLEAVHLGRSTPSPTPRRRPRRPPTRTAARGIITAASGLTAGRASCIRR